METKANEQKSILIALVPVIHARYIELFRKYPEQVYILGGSILKQWEGNMFLERDLRKIDQNAMTRMVAESGLVQQVKVLEEDVLEEIRAHDGPIVLPKEDVSEWFAETFLQGKDVIYEPIFLRWNKPVTLQEIEVPPNRTITEEEMHRGFMEQAKALTEKSTNWWRQIGTLAVKNGEVIVDGYNSDAQSQQNTAVYGDSRQGFNAGEYHELSNTIHGEAAMIADAAKKGISLDGADLYVTTFPCPTCAKLVARAGFKRVFYKDGYSLSDAEDVLKNAGLEIILVK